METEVKRKFSGIIFYFKENKKKSILILLVVILLIYLFGFNYSWTMKHIRYIILSHKKRIFVLYHRLKLLYRNNKLTGILLISLLQILIIVLMIPIHSIFCILIFFIWKNNYMYFFLIYLTSNISSVIVYLNTNYFFKKRVKNWLNKYEILNLIEDKAHEKPYLYSFWTKFIYLPMGFKEYLWSFIYKFKHFITGGMLFYLYETLQYLILCKGINNFREFLFNKGKKKHFLIGQIFLIIFLLFSFLISFLVGKYIKDLYKKKKIIKELNIIN